MTTVSEAPEDRFCDLVMKGGITSGVVYPKAIYRLSKHYRFKSIGGTSAGAIAAAVTAAAEYRRREDDSLDGFEVLAGLVEELQAPVPNFTGSRLLSLFQPQPSTRRLFSVLVRSLNKETYGRILAILVGTLLAYWPATLASVIVAAAVATHGPGWFTAALLLVILLVTSIGLWAYRDITRNVVQNGFGLCTGMTADERTEALTPWLHSLIQEAAGLPDNEPLTFGMLWGANGFPPAWITPSKGDDVRSIDLRMYSTNLGHGRPYIFPLPKREKSATHFRDRERLFFNANELKGYLPAPVIDCMRKHGKPYTVESGRVGIDPPESEATDLLEIPEPEHFPVLLAARMSLSFPFLFSAVPLWAINHDAPHGKRHFQCCWFSDGGISSNFPIHLFDGLVPVWPTFGIDLEAKIEGRDMVFLPERYTEGYGERWNNFADNGNHASRFGGFLRAIVASMQNWNDNSLARMPGVRDRIVRVRLEEDEGGLNLDMNKSHIGNIAARGEVAAEKLISRFAAKTTEGPQADGWDEQRFVRLGVLLRTIEKRVPGVISALAPQCQHATDFATLIKKATQINGTSEAAAPPPGYESPLTMQHNRALHEALKALGDLAKTLEKLEGADSFKPIPKPELRVGPSL